MAETIEDVEPLVTRCPECGTRFRVSEAQLQMAGGRVRCGSCLTVFFGTDHLQWDLEKTATTSDPTETLDALLKEIDVFEATDEARSHDELIPPEPLAEDHEVDDVAEPAPESAPEPVVEAWIDASETAASTESGVDIDSIEVTALPQDLSEIRQELAEVLAEVEPQPVAPADVVEAVVFEPPAPPAAEDRFVRLFEEPAETVVDLPEVEVTAPPEAEIPEDVEPAPTPALRRRQRRSRRPQVARTGAPESVEDQDGRVGARVAESAGPAVPEIDPAVLEPTPTPEKRRSWLGRSTFALVALALIGVQVGWYFFPAWAADPKMRWLPERICALTGCELAPLKALDQLLITDVVVRGHPENTGLRLVNVLLVNTAPFEQAFPEIEVAFRAPTGDLVAWKRVKAQEYLAPELRARPIIAAKTPVRIEIEIEDPGTQSYGYEISLK